MECKETLRVLESGVEQAQAMPEVRQHVARCEACAMRMEERVVLDRGLGLLRAETEGLGPSVHVEREVLAVLYAARVGAGEEQSRWQWMMACGLGLTAMVIAGALLAGGHRQGPMPVTGMVRDEPFTAMPYVVPRAPYERTTVMRTRVSQQVMQYAGFAVRNDAPGATVLADVVYGQDGRILALRAVRTVPGMMSGMRRD